jgi:hypothetical protein
MELNLVTTSSMSRHGGHTMVFVLQFLYAGIHILLQHVDRLFSRQASYTLSCAPCSRLSGTLRNNREHTLWHREHFSLDSVYLYIYERRERESGTQQTHLLPRVSGYLRTCPRGWRAGFNYFFRRPFFPLSTARHPTPSQRPRSQVNWCLARLTRSRASDMTIETIVTILGLLLFLPVEPSVSEAFRSLLLEFSLSLYRHPFICILFSSRFTSCNKFNFFSPCQVPHILDYL